MTPIQIIEACVEHWRENVGLYRRDDPRGEGSQRDWFARHCFGNNCPACAQWGIGLNCPLASPGECDEGDNCCGGTWHEAWENADNGTLTVSHLEAVLAYIEGVLAKMKEESR